MFLRSLLGPRNSLILLYDLKSEDALARMEEEVEEIGKYYQWAPLAEKKMGCAAITFMHPRKRVVLQAIPKLASSGTPFTLFLRSDCVGLNRLPIEDELELREIPSAERAKHIEQVWEHPDEYPRFGALPLEAADPMNYFATWAEILSASPGLRTVGLHLFFDPTDRDRLVSEKAFVETQMTQPINLMLVPRAKNAWEKELRASGFAAVLTVEEGEVRKQTDAMHLPRFVPRQSEEHSDKRFKENG